MKKKYLILLLLALAPFTYGNIHSTLPQKEFKLKYNFDGKKFEVKLNAANFDEAIDQGSTQCFNYFTKSKNDTDKVKMSEDSAIELIDTCANPIRA